MVDVNLLLRNYLLSQASVTNLLGTNLNGSIYALSNLPAYFNPVLGPAIQLFRSGGKGHEEIVSMVEARMQIRTWADKGDGNKKVAARLYGSIFDVLHGATRLVLPEGTILSALEVTGPQEMTDPDTGWVAVNSFYTVMAIPN